MLTAHLSRRYLWGVVGICLTAGVVMWGCAPQELPQPQQPPVDVSRRLAAIEECIARSQGALKAAAAAGISAGALAPANSSIADIQDTLDEVKKLAQQGKQQEATERATKGLEECNKIDAMVVKARQDAAERKVQAQMASEVETRIAWTVACIDGARQAIGGASAAGVKTAALTTALSALNRAETALQQGRELLAQSDPKGAIERLESAQADCQTVRDAADKAVAAKGKSAAPTARPRRVY
jgi:hypothetical protein